MTPKEKAEELVQQFYGLTTDTFTSGSPEASKQCALIAVDEILNLCWNGNKTALNYWEQVKEEIEAL